MRYSHPKGQVGLKKKKKGWEGLLTTQRSKNLTGKWGLLPHQCENLLIRYTIGPNVGGKRSEVSFYSCINRLIHEVPAPKTTWANLQPKPAAVPDHITPVVCGHSKTALGVAFSKVCPDQNIFFKTGFVFFPLAQYLILWLLYLQVRSA